MNLNKKQTKFNNRILRFLMCLSIYQNFFISLQSLAQESYKLNELEINRSSYLDNEDNLDFPTNPFEIVDMIRRANTMNDATNPSDAIDDAIKSFDIIKEDKQL